LNHKNKIRKKLRKINQRLDAEGGKSLIHKLESKQISLKNPSRRHLLKKKKNNLFKQASIKPRYQIQQQRLAAAKMINQMKTTDLMRKMTIEVRIRRTISF